ncbi:hypothetical protein [Terriglobus roseus]|uniref:DUF3108 domain-containing protein n=1 Tax=Terriglobus roseus TaxID=392734 RepID=A0A1G7NMY8_9BACT|nr:hypothetical protein [Terriglobus roseus]SDF75363.1 hypothetical protein SAMN05444167_3204 [Terriglobus roseus]
MSRSIVAVAILSTVAMLLAASAETIPVRHIQRPLHRLMVARTQDGKTVAGGEFTQTTAGDEVTIHLIYRFVDGSVDDEMTTYTQRNRFRLVRYHHVEKGPYFTKPFDFAVEAATGTVTNRTTDTNGTTHAESKHMNLPDDLANGIVGTLLLNVPHNTAPFRVSMLAPFGGGRLVQLLISPESDQIVQLEGQTFQATVFRVHPVLNGFVSIFARLIGLQPKDVRVWVLEGDDPAVAVVIGQLGGYGPVISSDLVGSNFSHE